MLFRVDKIGSKGRGLIANQNIPSYTSILIEEALIKVPKIESNCWHCLERAGTLVCSACKVARYCSKLHQKNDWKQVHKQECAFVIHCKQSSIPPPVRGVYRLSLVQNDLCYAVVHEKETHIISTLLAKHTGKPYQDLLLVGYKFATNAMGIMDSFGEGIGTGIFPTASLANHSCRPNSIVSFKKNGTLSLISIKDIKEGEEICISYCDVVQPCDSRRQDLKKRYGFMCDCELCCEPIDKFLGVICPSCSKTINLIDAGVIGCDCSVDYTDISLAISQAMEFYNRGIWSKVIDLLHGQVAPSHHLLFTALSSWQDQLLYAPEKQWDVIERVISLFIPCVEMALDRDPVALGTVYLKYAKLLIMKDPVPRKAETALQNSLELLTGVLGESHPMVAEAMEIKLDMDRFIASGGLFEE